MVHGHLQITSWEIILPGMVSPREWPWSRAFHSLGQGLCRPKRSFPVNRHPFHYPLNHSHIDVRNKFSKSNQGTGLETIKLGHQSRQHITRDPWKSSMNSPGNGFEEEDGGKQGICIMTYQFRLWWHLSTYFLIWGGEIMRWRDSYTPSTLAGM